MIRRVTTAAIAVMAIAAVAACGGSADPDGSGTTASTASTSTGSTVPPARPSATVAEAVDRGAAFVAPQYASIDVVSNSMFGYLNRNWGIEGLAGAIPATHHRMAGGGLDDEEILLLRLADPAAPVPIVPDGTEPTTAVLAPALHCDQQPQDAAALERLRALAGGGAYATTHAALAVGWMDELGCDVPADVRDEVVDRMATELAAVGTGPLTDLSVEQSAVLAYLGAADRIPAGWGDRVQGAQRADGGWGPERTPSTWHMTLLAMWTLEALQGPGSGAGIIADRS